MGSLTLTLTGNDSVLVAEYYPPIELNDGMYVCGLIDFQTYNSIPNVDESNNLFHYIDKSKIPLKYEYHIEDTSGKETITNISFDNIELNGIDMTSSSESNELDLLNGVNSIRIPTGSYEIEDIKIFLKKELGEDIDFSLKVNNNTLKSEIKCNHKILFNKEKSIGPLLGFSERILEENKLHVSDKPVNILKVNAVRIECNITTGAYINNQQAHTIHEFFPTSPPGYKIVEVPKNVIYLPVTVKSIHVLCIRLVDQDGHLINFRGETITVRVHIKKVN